MLTSLVGTIRRAVLLAACVLPLVAAPRLAAQQPTAEQAGELLRSRPDLVRQLRDRIATAGLTPDQIRARLRAAGYPEDLLDDYIRGADTTRQVTPGADVLEAIRTLGIVSRESADTLTALRDSVMRRRADSLYADTTGRPRQLPIFGLDVFRQFTTQFEGALAGPVSDNYRLGPGDVLVLILSGEVEVAYDLEVNRDGFVFIPQVGQLYVANLSLAQLRDLLYARLGRVFSGVRRGPNATTRFDVTVSRLRQVQVYVVGDVALPGAYGISAAGTGLTALYAAGGPTANGSMRRIEIRRGADLVDSLDVYDYLLRGINASPSLGTGDVVFVPVHGGRVAVTGSVVRPARYEILPGETLRDVLRMAGGFDAGAVRQRVQIHRILPPDSVDSPGRARVVIDVGAGDFSGNAAPGIPMEAGDSVVVFALPEAVSNYVTVAGNVYLEGRIGLTRGMKLSDAIRLAGGPRPDVYLDRILLSRMRPDSSRYQLRSAFRDTTGAVTDDLLLQDNDVIQVFSSSAVRPDVYVSVVGAVKSPGRFRYTEGMTVRDALLLAGGVTEDADLREAEVARIPEDRAPGTLARTITVPLDSTFLLARSPGGRYVGAPGMAAPAAGAPEVTLQPFDNLVVFRQTNWNAPRLVALTGRVVHPGRYALTSTTERLADLIERSGGLTSDAYPGGIAFYRVREVVLPRAAADSDTTLADTSDVAAAAPLPEPEIVRERVGIDLPKVLRDADARDNIILAAGDSIHIPEFDPVVLVEGGVNAPGPVAYTPGKSLDWYVNAAGGYSQRGDRNRAYVVQPNGKKEGVKRRFLLADTSPPPDPGARVYVPEKDLQIDPTPSNLPQILSTAAQVLAAIVTLIVVSRR